MSAFSLEKNLTIAVGATTSEKFPTGEYSGGSFRATAAITGNVNFDVSNDGTNWDTLTNATTTFNDLATPGLNKPRAFPSNLFLFKFARLKASTAQLTADAAVTINLYGS